MRAQGCISALYFVCDYYIQDCFVVSKFVFFLLSVIWQCASSVALLHSYLPVPAIGIQGDAVWFKIMHSVNIFSVTYEHNGNCV